MKRVSAVIIALILALGAFCPAAVAQTSPGSSAMTSGMIPPGLTDSVDAELRNTTTQIMGISTVCSYTAVKGSFTVTGRHVVAKFSLEGEGCKGIKGGDWNGNSKRDRPFAGSWKFTADQGLKNLRVEAEVGSTFSFQGKSFKLTNSGWAPEAQTTPYPPSQRDSSAERGTFNQ